MFSVAEYLARLGWHDRADPDEETLADLHELHMLEVPFENLDIHHHREIVLDENRFFEKIVHQKRGGFCYELNGVFAGLLRRIGFDVTMLSARVARAAGDFGPEFDHMVLLVSVDGTCWLADVGFGESFRRPLLLDTREAQSGGDPLGATYQIERDGDTFLLSRQFAGAWERQYEFTLVPRALADYAGMCHYHQTSSDSSFTLRKMCSRATREGRITLAGDLLIVTTREGRHETPVDDADWDNVLRDRLDVVVPSMKHDFE